MGVTPPDGVVDMVGNSLDGDRDDTAEGPAGTYILNNGSGAGDSAQAGFKVGTTIDLVSPTITQIIPQSLLNPGPPTSSDPYMAGGPPHGGPSQIPPSLPVTVQWSKVMSVSSMRVGLVSEVKNAQRGTVGMDVYEVSKAGVSSTEYSLGLMISARLDNPATPTYTIMDILHRPFSTANELGYTETEILGPGPYAGRTPRYEPVIGNRIKDTRQNCFFPSIHTQCTTGSGDGTNEFCCNDVRGASFNCPI
jgi:hypothetical protein